MFEKYKKMFKVGKFKTGNLLPYKILDSDRLVLNFPKKGHWRSSSKVEYIRTYDQKRITSISFPMLSSSNGGLDKVIIHGYASYSD